MKFSFTDEQDAFHDAVRDVFAQRADAGALRAAWSNATGRTDTAWSALHEMGVLDALRPESDGGLGLDETDAIRIIEASGRCGLPEPIVETMMVAGPLSAVASGDSAAVVCAEAPYGVWADTAAVVLHLTADGIASAPLDAAGVRRVESVDGARRLFDVSAATERAVPIDGDVAKAFRRAALGTAAQLCGLSETMLMLTVDYAKERRQFGAPIGSFQAVKHHLANARIRLEFARPLVYRAAASLANGDAHAGVHVSMAKVAANDAALLAGRASLQCHGAIGYTTEHDLHLYMKRAWALAATWGDAAWHRNRVRAAVVLGGHSHI